MTELLNKLVTDKRKLYKEQLIRFPAPKFFVLYNGNEFEPVEKIIRLSDAFGGDSSSLELIVTAYNINRGVNAPLLGKCPYLRDYSTLVGKVKDGLAEGLPLRNAIIRAAKFCLDNGIMSDYPVEHSDEFFTRRQVDTFSDKFSSFVKTCFSTLCYIYGEKIWRY
ncbi:MAG: hypothetical protein IKP64_04770 [Selenomonadaceae bacterium]|nr:hypothetical protein [Selenomonadaceae bacterium]